MMNFINCIAILSVVTFTSANPTATLDELVNTIVNDVMDHIQIEKDCKKECAKSNDYVCANNGVVYPSVCMMEQSGCLLKQNLTDVDDIYVCKESSNKKVPVCGSDYKTYSDRCEMEKTNCANKNKKDRKKITVLHKEKCKEQCKPDVIICHNSLKTSSPVCGSDGKTHESGCIKAFNCEQNENIAVVVSRECKKECTASRDIGRYFINKVCGSDGITYKNKFLMEQANCNSEQNITMSSKGEYTKGKLDMKIPTSCPMICPPVYKPVCANDGIIYPSICHMQNEFCRSKKMLRGVDHQICLYRPHENRISARCSMICQRDYRPICANDGNIYPSLCEMQNESCRSKKRLRVAGHEICLNKPQEISGLVQPNEECTNDDCHNAGYFLLCGSDRKNYSSICQLKLHNCKSTKKVAIASIGKCE